MALDTSKLKLEDRPLYVPPLQEVAAALNDGLQSHFENVSVAVVDCPDLTTEPFCLASPGLCGSTRVVEVGGVSHFLPLYNPDKVYDFKYFNQLLQVEPAAVIGTGAGPFSSDHKCCELVANCFISKSEVSSLNRIAYITDKTDKGFTVEFLPKKETKFVLMANLFVSNGNPGKVLRIHCKGRKSDSDFPAAVRKCLAERFLGHRLGLGGVFVVEGSQVRQHIPPCQFSAKPITTSTQLNSWLKFFDMNPPLVFVGTIVTDHLDMEMILQHFHSFSSNGEGGHYHYDTSPQSVEYLAYFSMAERAVHVDRPPRTSDLSVDSIEPTQS